MTDAGWILIIEQGERWTAAVQTCLRRLPDQSRLPRVRRVDQLPRLDDERAHRVFVGLELPRGNLCESLQFLDSLRRRPCVAAAALVDRQSPADLLLAANEAGASLVLDSPRDCDRLVATALKSLRLADQRWPDRRSLSAGVGITLPWQTEPWSVG